MPACRVGLCTQVTNGKLGEISLVTCLFLVIWLFLVGVWPVEPGLCIHVTTCICRHCPVQFPRLSPYGTVCCKRSVIIVVELVEMWCPIQDGEVVQAGTGRDNQGGFLWCVVQVASALIQGPLMKGKKWFLVFQTIVCNLLIDVRVWLFFAKTTCVYGITIVINKIP